MTDIQSGGDAETLRIFRRDPAITVLGPGTRAVIWVQGCGFACPRCIVPESWDFEGGVPIRVEELVSWIRGLTGIDGITLSGGEPMAQAKPLAALIDAVADLDLGVMCYTGYTYEYLVERGTPEQRTLLERLDLLVDGTYLESRHADLRWRGSSNQRLIPLTARYADALLDVADGGDHTAGLQIVADETGIAYAGVPKVRGFHQAFLAKSKLLGLHLKVTSRKEPSA